MSDRKREEQGDVLTKARTDKPKRYKVILYNDDYTTMEFVVWVLRNIFKHTPASSTRLMLAIHRKGLGVAGVYAKEIAETRVDQTLAAARDRGHPLQCTMEEE